ncbi:helix-turn-helix domain-containing protein [Photorhabdus aegyptia]|uniref:Helix-turn-helix protein n=1 Tax=Photorhabdus aegyptia TaxID=2805098 RepID=A0A022PG29_9GAMM|nr:helix-turn-helix transcriptional regulator [Photorhabdus aegyptia]EYU13420.1 Helix-turn-helix protein [Photorhabdus aegyptia]
MSYRKISEEQVRKFGERLKIAMNGMSNNAFAKQCGWSEKVIRNYLNGESYPAIDRLAIIANVSGCAVSWLVSGESNDISDIFTSYNSSVSSPTRATHEQQKVWKNILDKMTQEERKAVIDRVFKYGINAFLR